MKNTRAVCLILVGLFLIGGLVSGCKKTTQAQREAGKIWFKNPFEYVCRHRVAVIAKGMMEREETFDLVFGKSESNRHVWIEEYLPDGSTVIVEPTQTDSSPERYIETNRLPYAPDYDGNIAVISKVNNWLIEINKEIFFSKGQNE